MKFATFQSTYKPLPIDVYERTGQELEAKYYKNRDESSQLRQYMSKLQVEDRNIGHLAKATTDVETMFDQIDDKWHRAGNILYNAKDRIIQDKALNASIEDYAKSQSQKAEQQKRFEEGKIDQAALNAYYINDKRYNDKAIEIDENGQAKNRWATPTPISKVDIEKKVTDLVQLLNQHKSSLAVGATGQGSPLYEIYQANPRLEGYVTKYTASGNSPEKIAEAVRAWIDTTPEIKQYYNYINDATVFDAVTEKDENGKYLKDENGKFIQRDLTAKDFRDIGVSVADDWNTISNFTTVALPGGILTQIPVENQSDNLKNSGRYKELIESGLSDKEALQNIYSNTLTSMQTSKIVNFGRQFGYNEYNSEVIKDEGYWFNKNLRQKRLDEAIIFSAMEGKAPMMNANFSIDRVNSQLKELVNAQESVKEGTPEYNRMSAEIINLRNTQKALKDGFESTPEGADYVQRLYNKFLQNIPRADRNIFKQNEAKVKAYLTGRSETLGFQYNSKIAKVRGTGAPTYAFTPTYDVTVDNILSNSSREYNKALEKAVQKGSLKLDINTIDFVDDKGAISPVGENMGEFFLNRGDSFINFGALTKQGEPMTLDQYYKDNKIDASKYKAVVQFTDTYGKFAIKFIPRSKDIEPLKDDKRLIVEPNIDNKASLMNSIADLVQNQSTGLSPQVNKWINDTRSNSVFGNAFDNINAHRALVRSGHGTDEDMKEFYLNDIPMSTKSGVEPGNFKIVFNDNNTVSLFQLNPTTKESDHRATRTDLEQIQEYLFNQYIK